MLIEIETDKQTSFILEMKIDGDAVGAVPRMQFSIVSEDFTLSIPAALIENGVYEITCPKLKGILPPGEYEVKAEVFIEDKHFVPLSDTIRLKEAVQPIVTMPQRKPIHKPMSEARIAINIKAPEYVKPPEIVEQIKPIEPPAFVPTLTKTSKVIKI